VVRARDAWRQVRSAAVCYLVLLAEVVRLGAFDTGDGKVGLYVAADVVTLVVVVAFAWPMRLWLSSCQSGDRRARIREREDPRTMTSRLIFLFVLVALTAACAGSPPRTGDDAGAGADTGSAPGTVSLMTGFGHVCKIRSDGAVTCWGQNADGVATLPSGGYVQIAAANGAACGGAAPTRRARCPRATTRK
jgi:hypothetical protein